MDTATHLQIIKPSGLSIVSFFLGLTSGLIIAAYIAFYVTKTPVPFVDRLNDTNLINPNEVNSKAKKNDAVVKLSPDNDLLYPPDEMESLIDKIQSNESEKNDNENVNIAKKEFKRDFSKSRFVNKIEEEKILEKKVKAFFLQVGAFRSVDEAERMRARLAFLGFEAALYKKTKPGSIFYRVRLGPFNSKEELERVKKRLNNDSIKSHIVMGE
mgnify:CR=1 FL=1